METEFYSINADPVQSHSDNTVQPDTYTVQAITEQLGVSRRSVFIYMKTVCDCWHWLPEITFKPSFGRYSQRALTEMQLLQQLGADQYRLRVASEQKPIEFIKPSSSIAPDSKTLTIYESKVLTQQQLADSETLAVIQDLQQLKADIDETSKRVNQANNANREARLARLKVKAMKQALEDYQVMSEVYNSTIQQLEIENLDK